MAFGSTILGGSLGDLRDLVLEMLVIPAYASQTAGNRGILVLNLPIRQDKTTTVTSSFASRMYMDGNTETYSLYVIS